MLGHNLMGDGVVVTMVPVLDVLFRKSAVCRFLMPNDRVRFAQPLRSVRCSPERALGSPIALSLHKE